MAETLDRPSSQISNDFTYRPVPPLAAAALGTGVLSLLGILVEFALPLAVLGILFGMIAARQIRRSEGDYSGGGITKLGIGLCLFCLVGGSARLAWAIATEVPEGFRRVNFTSDISDKEFVVKDGFREFATDVKALDGENLFVKGYIYPTSQYEGLREFILCRDSGECCFGGKPKLTDMIRVRLSEDTPGVNFTSGLMAVAGEFQLADLTRAGELTPAYEMKVQYCSPAKSLY